MKTVPPGWPPQADPEALIKEARRRQRRRHMAIGLAIVLLAGAAGITVSLTGPGGHSSGGRSPRRPPALRAPSSGAFVRAALPAFFADTVTTGEANESLQVRASASGALVAQEENMPGVLSRTISQPQLGAASLSPSGASFYLCTQAGHVINVAGYRTSTGELQEQVASLRGAWAQEAGCSMALDTSGQFLLVPYSLVPAIRPILRMAEIDIATRAVTNLTIQLPPSAGMDPATGMIAAW